MAAIIIDQMWSTGLAGVSTSLFVFGHIAGAILMGLALLGSIPTLGWLAMLLTTPAHVLAFVVLQMPVLDIGLAADERQLRLLRSGDPPHP